MEIVSLSCGLSCRPTPGLRKEELDGDTLGSAICRGHWLLHPVSQVA